MKKIISGFGAAAIAAIMTVVGVAPVSAAPIVPQSTQVTSDVQLAQHRNDHRPEFRRDRDRRDRMDRRRDRPGYWNGHRGYREHRRGYRRHSDGYYYAPSVFKLYIR